MSKLFYYISLFSIFFSLALIVMVIYWIAYPYKVVEWKHPINTVLETTVQPGQNISYVSEYCKYYNIQPTITSIFQDSIIYYTPTTIGSTKQGCYSSVVSILVPASLPPGKYKVKTIYRYKVNPLREITYIRETEYFTVIR